MTQISCEAECSSAIARAMAAQAAAARHVLHCPQHGEYFFRESVFDEQLTTTCPQCAAALRTEKALAARRLALEKASGIPKRFRDMRFADLSGEHEQARKTIRAMQAYAEQFEEHEKYGRSLVLSGNTGTGKTLLACMVCEAVALQHGKSVKYATAYHIVRDIKASFGKKGVDESVPVQQYVSPDLLVIDEVGVQFGTDTEKLLLFEVVNGRYEAMRPTIVISNLRYDEMSEYLGDRLMDRLKEHGGAALVFDWASCRK